VATVHKKQWLLQSSLGPLAAENYTTLFRHKHTEGIILRQQTHYHLSIQQCARPIYTKTTHTLRLFSLCFYIYRQTSLLINYAWRPRVLSQLASCGSCWNFIDLQFEKNAPAHIFPIAFKSLTQTLWNGSGYFIPAAVSPECLRDRYGACFGPTVF
jgi:hypothetical protein